MPIVLDMGMSRKHRVISHFTPALLWEGHPSTEHRGLGSSHSWKALTASLCLHSNFKKQKRTDHTKGRVGSTGKAGGCCLFWNWGWFEPREERGVREGAVSLSGGD